MEEDHSANDNLIKHQSISQNKDQFRIPGGKQHRHRCNGFHAFLHPLMYTVWRCSIASQIEGEILGFFSLSFYIILRGQVKGFGLVCFFVSLFFWDCFSFFFFFKKGITVLYRSLLRQLLSRVVCWWWIHSLAPFAFCLSAFFEAALRKPACKTDINLNHLWAASWRTQASFWNKEEMVVSVMYLAFLSSV